MKADNGPVLGKLIATKDATRDAIHVAVVPLIAGEDLYAGSKFKLKFNTKDVAIDADYGGALGIVDPFLDTRYVHTGKRFWGMLFPNTVTGMQHQWKHPAFDTLPSVANKHEKWLREFADKYNFDWDQLISIDKDQNDYVVARGIDLHGPNDLDPTELEAFWFHLGEFKGIEFTDKDKARNIWSCSC